MTRSFNGLLLIWMVGCGGAACAAQGEEPKPPQAIRAVSYSPDGALAVAARSNRLEIGSPGAQPEQRWETSMSAIHALRFAPDGQQLAVIGGRPAVAGVVELRDWPSGTVRVRTELQDDVLYAAAYLPDGSAFITGSFDATVGMLTLPHGTAEATWEGHSKGVLAVAAADELVVTAGIDEALRVRNVQGEVLRTLPQHRGAVYDLAWQPDVAEGANRLLASAGGDRTVRFWQPRRNRLVRFARLPAVPLALAWVPGTSEVLVACEDGHLRGLDATTVRLARDWPLYDAPALCLAVHPQGTRVLVGSARGELQELSLSTPP